MSRLGRNAKRRAGFSLVEMMVTVALIGFLGSLAYPSYALFVAKSHRSEAIVALSALYKWQLAYYTANGR
jgi:type IV pilus assembly protein PilE